MTDGKKLDLMSMDIDELAAVCAVFGQPSYRAKQIFSFLSRGVGVSDMSSLPKSFRAALAEASEDRLPRVERKQVSSIDGTVKYLFRLLDGECVESVFMRYEHGNTLCISSEVGCPMGCTFCASTLGGKVRPLYPSEMLGQIIATERDLGERVSGVVMMGIGEPLDNYENTVKFLRLCGHPDGLNIGYRHISLSTCGVVPGILALAKEGFPITLSISLHAVTDEQRSRIMPVNRKWGLDALLSACAAYYRQTGRRISFEYTLLSGVNDSDADADALAALLRRHLGGMPLHVNLIRVNEVAEREFVRGTKAGATRFAARLGERGVNATVRRRLGADIDAACGQLRRRKQKEDNKA